MAKVKTDIKSALAGLDMLNSPKLRESLARSMCVAGGKLLRDEAAMLVPVDTGRLKASLYLAFSPEASTGTKVEYHVSWRKGKGQMGGGAPHGHLIEFGHWKRGTEGTRKGGDKPRTETQWVPAQPFLRPALEGGRERAYDAMIARGRERLPELLNGGGDDRE